MEVWLREAKWGFWGGKVKGIDESDHANPQLGYHINVIKDG